jgi:flagellar hook-length control protein FliK
VPTVPSDPVQPGAPPARAASPQTGPQPSGETSPFEVLLGSGNAPPAQVPSKLVHPGRTTGTSQSTIPAAGLSQQRAASRAPGTRSPPPPTRGSNDDSRERPGLVEDSDPRVRVAADTSGVTTAKLPVHTSTGSAAGATTKGAPMEAGRDSSAPDLPLPTTPDHPMPDTSAHKSDTASAKGSTVDPPTPGPMDSVAQPAAGPTLPAPSATPPVPVPALAPAPTQAVAAGAASQSTAIPVAADAVGPATGLGAALASSATTPDLTSLPGDPTLPLDPTAQGTQAAALGSTPAGPTSAASAGDKASDGTADSDDVGVAKPTPSLARTAAPMASSGTASDPLQSANAQVHIASAAANATNHADATLAGGAHVDPSGDGAASPSAAAGPSGSALAQSAAPPVSANSPVPTTATPAAAAPATPSPSSSAAVPMSGLAIEIAARAAGDEKSFQIRLDPPELGRIDVQLNVDASGHVTTHLTADRPETLNLLRQDASSLQRALESTGLKAGSGGLEFSLRNQSFGGEAGGQRGGQSNGTTSPIARIVVPDEDMPAGQTATRGYARLLGVGAGVDIRV